MSIIEREDTRKEPLGSKGRVENKWNAALHTLSSDKMGKEGKKTKKKKNRIQLN